MGDMVREKRELARRARRLAETQMEEADKALLYRYADELEQHASDLEREADQPAAAGHPSTTVTQQQQQVQQQQATEPPIDPEKPKT
jgi:hypothetical protein